MRESLQLMQNSTSTWWLMFFLLTYWKQDLFVCIACVCPWAKNDVCNSHLPPFKCFYVEGPDFIYIVNVISLYFSMYLKCIEYIIWIKAFQ